MKAFQLLLSLCLLSNLSLQAQPAFDMADFHAKAELANWLYIYDAMAWWTTDSLMTQDTAEINRLGSDWFCFQDEDSLWHAVYGKYERDRFDLVFHFVADTAFEVSRTYEAVDTSILHPYSRALRTASNRMDSIGRQYNLRFNQYIKPNEDGTYFVMIFPAFQPSGHAVYGGEFVYTIDETGSKVLEDKSYYQGAFRAFEVGEKREVWMDYTELAQPTLGTTFFVWYYKKYFTNIMLDNERYITTAMAREDGSYFWVHTEKELESEKNKTKKRKRKRNEQTRAGMGSVERGLFGQIRGRKSEILVGNITSTNALECRKRCRSI